MAFASGIGAMWLTASLAALLLVCGAARASPAPDALLQLAQADPQRAFTEFLLRHDKKYDSIDEHQMRYGIWLANVQLIAQHASTGSSMQLALNEFADLTWEEFAARKTGFKGAEALQRRALKRAQNKPDPFSYAHIDVDTLPTSLDWREKGAVTPVKNQGQCGSCWSFSATGAIEGINAIKTGNLLTLSEQQLVDCDTKEDMGCGGGLMDNAFEYVKGNGGLDTEEDYQYWSSWGMTFWGCNRKKEQHRTVVKIDGYEDVPQDEESLLKAAAHQPIAVGICASPTMQFYSGGVIDKCCEELNHGVLLVGYGEEGGVPYWLVKNSWGGGWGMEGYFKLQRGTSPGGLCGIASTASYPTKTSPNPEVPQMCDIFGWTECAAKATCSCSFNLLGLVCLWHDCCPLENGVTCSDNQHCCPAEAPVCDVRAGACVSEDGSVSLPWTDKAKATVMSKGAAKVGGSKSNDNRAEPSMQRTDSSKAPGAEAGSLRSRLSLVIHSQAAGGEVDYSRKQGSSQRVQAS